MKPFELCRMVTADDDKNGQWLILTTPKQHIDIRITKTGFIRIGEVRKGRFPVESWQDGGEQDTD